MDKLLDVDTLRTRLGEMDIQDINDLLSSALGAVTPSLSSFLRTPFEQKAGQEDIFYIDPKKLTRDRLLTKLQLSRGFVSGIAEDLPTVQYGDTYELLTDNPETLTAPYTIDYERGTVRIVKTYADPIWIKVTYKAGFAVTAGVYQSVPGWLVEAVVQYAATVYRMLIELKGQDADTKAGRDQLDTIAHIPDSVERLLNPYVRWMPTGYDPLAV